MSDTDSQTVSWPDCRRGHQVSAWQYGLMGTNGRPEKVVLPVHPDDSDVLIVLMDEFWIKQDDMMFEGFTSMHSGVAEDENAYATLNWRAIEFYLRGARPEVPTEKRALIRLAQALFEEGVVGPEHIARLSTADRRRVIPLVKHRFDLGFWVHARLSEEDGNRKAEEAHAALAPWARREAEVAVAAAREVEPSW